MTGTVLQRIRERPNDSPLHAEFLMDDAGDLIEQLQSALVGMLRVADWGAEDSAEATTARALLERCGVNPWGAAAAPVDTHPQGGDAVAAPFMGSAVDEVEAP